MTPKKAAKNAAPEWLDATGQAVWSLSLPMLERLGVFGDTDRLAFARYCDHTARWLRLRDKVDKKGESYWTKSKHGRLLRANPDFRAMLALEDRMRSLEDRFGLAPAGGDGWRVLCRFWLPGADLEERIRSERVPYDLWAADGAITLTEGDAADHDAIKAQILTDIERFDVQGIGFDPWNAHKLMVELNEIYPDLAVRVSQTMATLSGPSKLLERLVLTTSLDHGNHPVLRWMADNVATITDTNGNIKPAKNKSTQKIDGIVALIIALALTQGEQPGGLPNTDALVTL